jgi:hypothetical protein
LEDKAKDFQDGEYQWADEPDEIFFKDNNVKIDLNGIQSTNTKITENLLKNRVKITKKSNKNEPELSQKELHELLKRRHKEELLKTKQIMSQNPVKLKIKEHLKEEKFEISDKYLKKQIFLNKDIMLYEKKWLFDREFKFFFSSTYYQNILATDLRWREDYQHILFIRLMSYHNIGNLYNPLFRF